MDKTIIIGISGGTGAGKSTVSFSLRSKYPKKISVIHFDDYQRKKEMIPLLYEIKNYDHPDAIDFKKLIADIKKLKSGKTVTVFTKNETDNKKYKKNKKLIPLKIKSLPVIIVEGYLLLWNPNIRNLLDEKIFLDLDYKTRIKRRTKLTSDKYNKKILFPMQKKFVESTKKYADLVIDVAKLSKKQLISNLETRIKEYFK